MPATDALNGYLYSVALRSGGIPRLGYSYWAEDAYDYIEPILEACRKDLGLNDENMTFFVAHSKIDEKHAQEVKEAILKWAKTDEEKQGVIQVAKTSLYLTGEVLNSSVQEIEKQHKKAA